MPISFNMMLTDNNSDKLDDIRLAYDDKHHIGLTRMEIVNCILKMVFKNYNTANICDKIWNILHPPKKHDPEQTRRIKGEQKMEKHKLN